ncbi:hypothetical protein Tco_1324409, partial [Tanacetum coccineum]
SSSRPKLYVVTPLPKSTAFPKVGKMNALSNQVTSNSVPSSRKSTVVNNERVIAPGIFRINPFKASRYVNGMKSRMKNQSGNLSKSANQKKQKANVKKSKTLSSEDRLASSRPSKPKTCLKWLPTGRIFDLCRKITSSSNTESESDTSVCDNASASNPQEPTNKGFPSSTSFLPSWKLYSVICSTNYSNGENQVVSKSSVVTTADASDKRQQQQDLTSSTSILTTTITADGNLDL